MAAPNLSKVFLRYLSHQSFSCRKCSSNQSNTVLYEQIGKVVTIGINRPEKRNCINSDTAKLLLQAFQQFEADDSALAAVLYGKGGNFCAGYDLEELARVSDDQVLPEDHAPMGPSYLLTDKPVIAAISGYAVAGGMELALMCDMRVVEDTAVMGVFCRRFGVPLLDGGSVRLPALIGISRAMDLILTGRSIGAQEAFSWGLANRIVACGTGLGQGVHLANSLVKYPQLCLRADRRSAYHSVHLQQAFAYERKNGMGVLAKESINGAKKFLAGIGKHGRFNLDKPAS